MVHPDHQKMGVGKTLVQYRIEQIRSQDLFNKVIVRTSQLAYLFYQKMGFNLEMTRKNFWATGFDLYQMSMDIYKTGGSFREGHFLILTDTECLQSTPWLLDVLFSSPIMSFAAIGKSGLAFYLCG